MTKTVKIDGEPVEVSEAAWTADPDLVERRVREWRERNPETKTSKQRKK